MTPDILDRAITGGLLLGILAAWISPEICSNEQRTNNSYWCVHAPYNIMCEPISYIHIQL